MPAWEDLPFSWRAAINKKKEEGCENQREICSHQMEIGELGRKKVSGEGSFQLRNPIEKSNREIQLRNPVKINRKSIENHYKIMI